jgi:hypothetical protein
MDRRLIAILIVFVVLVILNRPIRRLVEQLNAESFVIGANCNKNISCGYGETCINSKCRPCKPPNCK